MALEELQLNGENEGNRHASFYGSLLETMPELLATGRFPASIAYGMKRRLHAPAEVIPAWRNHYIFTGDGAVHDGRGNAKVVLDAALLREINQNTRLDNYDAVLSPEQWEELRGDDVLYLSADKVDEQIQGKGFVKKNGVWQPENTVVGDVWNHLSRGKDLKDYAEMVHQASGNDRVMWLWFGSNAYALPVMRSLVVDGVGNSSGVDGYGLLSYLSGRLVGVAPEAQVSEQEAPARRSVQKTDSEERILQPVTKEIILPIAQPYISGYDWKTFSERIPDQAPALGDVLLAAHKDNFVCEHSTPEFDSKMRALYFSPTKK